MPGKPKYARLGLEVRPTGSASSLAVTIGGMELAAANRTGFYTDLPSGDERLTIVSGGVEVAHFLNNAVSPNLKVLGFMDATYHINVGDLPGGYTVMDGDIWYDGTDFNFRADGVTITGTPIANGTTNNSLLRWDSTNEAWQETVNALITDGGQFTITEYAVATGYEMTPVAANPGSTSTLWADTNNSDALMYGGDEISTGTRMRFRNEWVDGNTYYLQDTVTDDGWTMVANKTTTERPSPQASGDPFWVSGYDDNPPWTENSISASLLATGQRYTWGQDGYANRFRFWIPEAGSDIYYEGLLIEDPDGTPAYNFTGKQTFSDTGWKDMPIGQVFVVSGTVMELLLLTQNQASGSSSFSHDWQYKQDNGNPSSGEAWHQSGGSQIRIHEEDDTSTDRSADLDTVKVGDNLTISGTNWEITSTVKIGSVYRFGVTPATRISENTYSFLFTIYNSALTEYVLEANKYLGNPNIRGLFEVDPDDYSSLPQNDNAYGVDIQVQEAIIPEDWDFLAYSGNVSGGGSSEPPSTPPLVTTGSSITLDANTGTRCKTTTDGITVTLWPDPADGAEVYFRHASETGGTMTIDPNGESIDVTELRDGQSIYFIFQDNIWTSY